jgi:nucleotide-binding universal stress UspA family protein
MSFDKILIAVDRGPIAAHAVDVGVTLANSLKAELALIHVTEPPAAGSDAGISIVDYMKLARGEGQRLLTGMRQRHSLPASVQEFLEAGDAAAEIVKTAKEWPADMIVVGSHGRSGLSRVMLGSVAETVLRHAPCAVPIVRAHV